jgi:hypothetical protein
MRWPRRELPERVLIGVGLRRRDEHDDADRQVLDADPATSLEAVSAQFFQ